MILFLPKDTWTNQRGFSYGKPVKYLAIGYHAGQDFHSHPIGKVPVTAPCAGLLTTFKFSKSAGWWGHYTFGYKGEMYSLKLLHMHKQMEDGEYKEGDIIGYCGATGLSVTRKYGNSYIGESHEEQISDRAVPHLHVELHKGEYQHDTNKVRKLADERTIEPISKFETWVKEEFKKKEMQKSIVNEEESTTNQAETSDLKEASEVKQKVRKSQDSVNIKNKSVLEIIIDALKKWLKSRK